MTRKESFHQNNQELNTRFSAAELALIGEVVTTVGDLISTYSAVLAVEEERKEVDETKNIQSQLDYLLHEIQELKQQVRHDRTRRF